METNTTIDKVTNTSPIQESTPSYFRRGISCIGSFTGISDLTGAVYALKQGEYKQAVKGVATSAVKVALICGTVYFVQQHVDKYNSRVQELEKTIGSLKIENKILRGEVQKYIKFIDTYHDQAQQYIKLIDNRLDKLSQNTTRTPAEIPGKDSE